MNGNGEADERPTKRLKVDIACETCRQRKTRCDGKRPICTHCESLSLNCLYRKPAEGTSAEVLARLTEAEARLHALETMNMQAWANGSVRQCQGFERSDIPIVPQLHTAASHKILQNWPRLRVKFTHPTIELSNYLRTADAQDMRLARTTASLDQAVSFSALFNLLQGLRNFLDEIPVALAYLIHSSDLLSIDRNLSEYGSWDQDRIVLDSLPIGTLLLCVIAQTFANGDSPTMSHAAARFNPIPSAQALFTLVLQDSWKLYARNPGYQIPVFLLIAYIHVYIFSRPFHAVGLLSHVGSLLALPFVNYKEDHVRRWIQLHYLLESDLFTELDGFSSTPSKYLTKEIFWGTDDGSSHATQRSSLSESPMVAELFLHHLQLRMMLNDTLLQLYEVSKAYVHPNRIGETVSRISCSLEDWYRSLPLSMQFSRSVMGNSGTAPQGQGLSELSQRYYACQFLLNRPVFYFVLHEDMEQSASPPEIMAAHGGVQPWMQDACHMSVKSAVVLLELRNTRRRHNDWCDNQLLLAAYLMTLQAQLKPETSGLHRQFGDVNGLLYAAETVLELNPMAASVDQWSLEVLRNVRQNVRASLQNNSSPR